MCFLSLALLNKTFSSYQTYKISSKCKSERIYAFGLTNQKSKTKARRLLGHKLHSMSKANFLKITQSDKLETH